LKNLSKRRGGEVAAQLRRRLTFHLSASARGGRGREEKGRRGGTLYLFFRGAWGEKGEREMGERVPSSMLCDTLYIARERGKEAERFLS